MDEKTTQILSFSAAFYLDRPKQTKKEVSLFSEEDFAKVGQRKFAASIKRIK